MADLRTDYKDDVLNINTNERRKYRMINNADGTISFEDVTDYVQNGDSFGSADINAITEKVNKSLTSDDVVDNLESTATDLPLSANMGQEIIEKIEKIEYATITPISNSYGANILLSASYAALKNGICYLHIQYSFTSKYAGWVTIGKLPFIPDVNGVDVFDMSFFTGTQNDPSSILIRVEVDGNIKIIPNGTTGATYVANVVFPYKKAE